LENSFFKHLEIEDEKVVHHIVTEDETWIQHVNPEAKEQSKQHTNFPINKSKNSNFFQSKNDGQFSGIVKAYYSPSLWNLEP